MAEQAELQVENENENEEKKKGSKPSRSLQKAVENWSIDVLQDRNRRNKILFDIPIQRGYVWSPTKKSRLIRSIILNRPINLFFFNRVDSKKGVYEGTDGKQRNNAIMTYLDSVYPLKGVGSVTIDGKEYELEGRRYDELDEAVQQQIMDYVIQVHVFNNLTYEENIEMFIDINSNTPIKAADLTRIQVKGLKTFVELTEHPGLKNATTEKIQSKREDEDIIQDIYILTFFKSDKLSLLNTARKEILRENDVTEEQKHTLLEALDYMVLFYEGLAGNKRQLSKVRNKTNITMVGYMATEAIRRGISKEEYAEKATRFYNGEKRKPSISNEYNEACMSGAAKRDNVGIRMREVEKALD